MTMDKIIKKKIGKETYTYVVRGEDLHAVEMQAKKLSFYDVPSCGLCKSDDLYLTAYITEEDKYKYLKIVCRNCKGSLTFGTRKDEPDTYYLRKNGDGGLAWKANEQKSSGTPENAKEPTGEDEGMPF